MLQHYGILNDCSISILRLDLPDPLSGGNKFFKLKYNLEEMRRQGKQRLLTFGGAFSNHIAAVAAAGKAQQEETIGVIRGEELSADANAVLRFATSCGMRLRFISREEYRQRNNPEFLAQLSVQFDQPYLLPEGGSNALAVKGCMEILSEETAAFDEIFCPVGTGVTLAGLIAAANEGQRVTGIAILEGKNYPETEIHRLLEDHDVKCDWSIDHRFTFGGYAKTNALLDEFIAAMHEQHALPLDHVYSGKAFYALHEIVKGDAPAGRRLLFVHTGGYAFSGNRPKITEE